MSGSAKCDDDDCSNLRVMSSNRKRLCSIDSDGIPCKRKSDEITIQQYSLPADKMSVLLHEQHSINNDNCYIAIKQDCELEISETSKRKCCNHEEDAIHANSSSDELKFSQVGRNSCVIKQESLSSSGNLVCETHNIHQSDVRKFSEANNCNQESMDTQDSSSSNDRAGCETQTTPSNSDVHKFSHRHSSGGSIKQECIDTDDTGSNDTVNCERDKHKFNQNATNSDIMNSTDSEDSDSGDDSIDNNEPEGKIVASKPVGNSCVSRLTIKKEIQESTESLPERQSSSTNEDIPAEVLTEEEIRILKGILSITRLENKQNVTGSYDCPQCGKNCNRLHDLKRHILSKHQIDQPQSCEQCGKVFNSPIDMTRHIRRVHSEVMLTCDACEFTTKYKTSLMQHLRAVHMKEKPFTCTQCEVSFPKRFALVSHVRAVHNKERSYECTMCSRSFKCSSNLNSHMKVVHCEKKVFSCPECKYSCPRQCDLRHHQRVRHNKVKIFQCEECDFLAATKSQLKRHGLDVHSNDRPFKCKDCGHSFPRKYSLEQHIRTVHVGLRPHACDQCDKAFAKLSSLKSHILVSHEGQRLHKCSECGDGFTHQQSLVRHMKNVHEHARPFVCEVCKKSFARRCGLTNHVAIYHKDALPFKASALDASSVDDT